MEDYQGLWFIEVLLIILSICTLVAIVIQTTFVYFSTKVALCVLAICVLYVGKLICKYVDEK